MKFDKDNSTPLMKILKNAKTIAQNMNGISTLEYLRVKNQPIQNPYSAEALH